MPAKRRKSNGGDSRRQWTPKKRTDARTAKIKTIGQTNCVKRPFRLLPSWTDLLGASARARCRAGPGRRCLVLLRVFLVLALMSGLFVLGGWLLRMFLYY